MGWVLSPGINDGYPVNTDNQTFAATPELSPAYVMRLDSAVNNGYPHMMPNTVYQQGMTAPYPYGIMRIDPSGVINDGYPYLWYMDVPTPSGINLLRMRGQQPTALYYGASAVSACYYNGQLVYRP